VTLGKKGGEAVVGLQPALARKRCSKGMTFVDPGGDDVLPLLTRRIKS
jgi:hypothetical protein